MESMTRPIEDVRRALDLHAEGVSTAEVARRTAIPRSTIRYWLDRSLPYEGRVSRSCQPCPFIERMPTGPYAYLLGLYLGDGCLSEVRGRVFRLRITLDERYPGIIDECSRAMALPLPNKVGTLQRQGCVEVYSHSKHWICLFPQHGLGPKHLRPIVLTQWQRDMALDRHPYLFLRGLVQSDGWRGTNRVPGGYEYPRYMFSNRSADIRQLFQAGCQRMAINCRPTGKWQVAVSRRKDVARMDVFIGIKR